MDVYLDGWEKGVEQLERCTIYLTPNMLIILIDNKGHVRVYYVTNNDMSIFIMCQTKICPYSSCDNQRIVHVRHGTDKDFNCLPCQIIFVPLA